MALSLPHFT